MKRAIFLSLLIINFSYSNALDYVNNIRAHSGAGVLKYSKSLSAASKKHAIYLETNHEYGHSESSHKRAFYGAMPWNRIANAGFGSKAVVENISFRERNYRASINKIMATVYHRLAFLDTKVDSLGFAKYAGIYVYDMGNSRLSNLCRQSFSSNGSIVDNICKNRNKQLPLNLFRSSINRVKSRSKDVIIYPYANQIGVSVSLADERPRFIYRKGYGFPVSVLFNSYYWTNVSIEKFELKAGNRVVPSKIVTFGNDIANKLKKGTFILLPLHKLKRHTKYRVNLSAITDGKSKKLSWSFTTR